MACNVSTNVGPGMERKLQYHNEALYKWYVEGKISRIDVDYDLMQYTMLIAIKLRPSGVIIRGEITEHELVSSNFKLPDEMMATLVMALA